MPLKKIIDVDVHSKVAVWEIAENIDVLKTLAKKYFINEKYQNSWQFVKWTTLVYSFWAILNNYLIIINYYKQIKINYIIGGTSLLLFPLQILFAYFGIYHMFILQLLFLTIYIFILNRNLGLYFSNN